MNIIDLFKQEKNADIYKSGDLIFEEGEAADKMYVIRNGQVDIKVGDTVVLTVNPGELLGEMALIDNSPRSATAIARSDCELIPIDVKRFTFMVQQTPFFSLHVMRVIVDRLRKMNEIINV